MTDASLSEWLRSRDWSGVNGSIRTASALLVALELVALVLDTWFSPMQIPVYTHMMLSVSLVLYIGCQKSLVNNAFEASSAFDASSAFVASSGPAQEEAAPRLERMKRSDVLMFPVMGSCALLSLFLLVSV
jgi:hypothetical protein